MKLDEVYKSATAKNRRSGSPLFGDRVLEFNDRKMLIEAIHAALAEPEGQALLSQGYKLVSTEAQLSNGTVVFEHPVRHDSDGRNERYAVYANGNVRVIPTKSTLYRLGGASIRGSLPHDLTERYRTLFANLLDYVKRTKRDQPLGDLVFTSRGEIERWLKSLHLEKNNVTYEIHANNHVSLRGRLGSVYVKGNIKRLPVKFDECESSFFIECKNLVTLEGAPTICSGNFMVRSALIEDLTGGPQEVSDTYSVMGCPNLKSLKGIPSSVDGLRVELSNLTDFSHLPQQVKTLFGVTLDKKKPFPLCTVLQRIGGIEKVYLNIVGLTRENPFQEELKALLRDGVDKRKLLTLPHLLHENDFSEFAV